MYNVSYSLSPTSHLIFFSKVLSLWESVWVLVPSVLVVIA